MASLTESDLKLIKNFVAWPRGFGYVLDHSDRTFSDFFRHEFGVDINQDRFFERGGSKGNRLVCFCEKEPDSIVARVLKKLWTDANESAQYQQKTQFEKPVLSLLERLEGQVEPETIKELPSESADYFTDEIPSQESGPRFFIRNGRIENVSTRLEAGTISFRLHQQLRDVALKLKASASSLGNKYPSLLQAIHDYVDVVDCDASQIDVIQVYSAGLDLETEFLAARKYGDAPDEEYPELSHSETTSISKLLVRHAPYVQSIPEVASLVEASDRYNRSAEEERAFSSAVEAAAAELLIRPDIVDSSQIQLIHSFANPTDGDPNAARKKAFSKIGIRNFVIVAGLGAVMPFVAGTTVGVVVGVIAGPTLGVIAGGVVSERTSKGLSPILKKTKAHKDFSDTFASKVDEWVESEKPLLGPLSKFFKERGDLFSATLDNSGIDQWFNEIQATLAMEKNDRQSGPQYPLGVLYENSDWLVDIEGMSALDGSREFSIGNIFAVSEWSMSNSEDIDLYHAPMHMSLKSRTNLDEFVDAWLIALDAHSSSSRSHKLRPEVLQATLDDLSKNNRLSRVSINQFQQFIENLADNSFI